MNSSSVDAALVPLLTALYKKAGFEAVQAKEESPKQVRILGRVLEDVGGRNGGNWKILIYRFLTAMPQRPWKVDICKTYFIREDTKKLVFAWRLIFRSEAIASCYKDLIHLVATSPMSARSEVMEFPLAGVDPDRNNPAGGKRGAGPAGTVMVGPAAVRNRMLGG